MTRVLHLLAFVTLSIMLIARSEGFAANDVRQALVVSLPQGGCSMAVFPDGSASIFYGAAPRSVRVASNTFHFEQLVDLFQADLMDRQTAISADTIHASVCLPGTSEVKLVNNHSRVRNLLVQGWQARLPPRAELQEHESYAWVKRACDFK